MPWLPLGDALEPGPLEVIGLEALLGVGRLGELLTVNFGIFSHPMTVSEKYFARRNTDDPIPGVELDGLPIAGRPRGR